MTYRFAILFLIATLLVVACKGDGDSSSIVPQEPAKASTGVAQENLPLHTKPNFDWWIKTPENDRFLIIYSADAHGEIDPCG